MDLSQALFDHFCTDMDDNLREMGVGDLTVPKRMQAFGEAFYGRTAAYDLALADGREPLAQAFCKNILNGAEHRKCAAACRLCRRRPIASLAGADEAALLGGSWKFPRAGQSERTAMSRDRHDRKTGSLARSRHRRANPGDRTASRHRGRLADARRPWPRSRACAKSSRRRPRST